MATLNSLSKCPNCHANQLIVDEKGNYVCRACDQVFSAAQIEGSANANIDAMAGVVSAAIREIDSPDSALIYLETFFGAYDWDAYCQSPDIYIEDLRVMVEKNKVKQPGNHKTWQLEAASIVYPLQKKLAGLDALQEKMIEAYTGDVSDIIDEFSTYNLIASAIADLKSDIIRALVADVQNMKRFGAPAEDVSEVESTVEELKIALAGVEYSAEIEELPKFKAYLRENEAKLVRKYSEKGIDAPHVYEGGVRAYEEKNYAVAAASLEKVRKYRDSGKYLNLINSSFTFGEIIEAGGKIFKFDYHKEIFTPDVAKKGCKKAKKEEAPAGTEPEIDRSSFDLYEIVNQAPAEKPVITSLSQLLCCYGGYIYYLKGKDKLCVYDVTICRETVLDTSKNGYCVDGQNNIGKTFDNTKLYVKKNLEFKLTKGCADKLGLSFLTKKKKEEEIKSQQNNYAMLLVDLTNATITTPIPKMVSCFCLRDFVFYTVSEAVSEDKHHRKTYETHAKMCNLSTGDNDVLFVKPCEILGVSGNYVIYDTWTPNSLNRELRAIDYTTREDFLLDTNVYQFIQLGNGKVLYTVGNNKYATLYAINYDGTGRTEVLTNFRKSLWWSITVRGAWMYMARGNMIMKVSLETLDKLILAVDLKEIISISGNYVYYISTNSDFRVVRLDGENNICIASGLSKNDISIGVSHVYYLRSEWVGYKTSKSVYRMDLDGHNIRKVMFDVEKMGDRNPNIAASNIYILKKETKNFKITVGKNSHEEAFTISTYYTLNKISGERNTLLVLGMPNSENYATLSKKGCLGKKKNENVVIEEIEPVIDYGQYAEEDGGGIEGFLNNLQGGKSSNNTSAPAGQGCANAGKGNKAASAPAGQGCANSGKSNKASSAGQGCAKK